jgi:hypothetical protein
MAESVPTLHVGRASAIVFQARIANHEFLETARGFLDG